ncbi:MAG: hypothetical protein AB7O37_16070 [Vicinamibacteria bacterium]
MRLAARLGLAVSVAACALGGGCSGAPLGERPAPRAVAVALLSRELSEPAGSFDTDNLVSNETSYLQVADELHMLGRKGGVYVGVGPEQNFSYIARLRPSWAYVLDVRRGNLLQHLMLAALLADAEDPYHYLCGLFARPCPATTPGPAAASLEGALAALADTPGDRAVLRERALRTAAWARTAGFELEASDLKQLGAMQRAFFEGQLELRFRSFGRRWQSHHPSYRRLLGERSPSGRYGHFLASAEDYAVVRDLARAGRIVPIVGDFAGPKALRALGERLRRRGETVAAFYLSNVEYYLLRGGSFGAFVRNLGALPAADDSLLIRACFDYGRRHPAAVPGHRSTTVLQSLPRFLELARAGAYESAWDVCTLDYVRPE